MNDKCRRCGKEGHTNRVCRVSFSKAFPGEPAMMIKLRSAVGSMEVETPLSADQHAAIGALVLSYITPQEVAEQQDSGGSNIEERDA